MKAAMYFLSILSTVFMGISHDKAAEAVFFVGSIISLGFAFLLPKNK